MTPSNLTVEVHGTHILVVLRGICFRAKYRKQDDPWLATEEVGPDLPGATITLSESATSPGRPPMRLLVS